MRVGRGSVAWARRRPALLGGVAIAVLVAWLLSAALFSSKVLGAQDVLLFQTPFAEAGKPAAAVRPSNGVLFDTFYQLQPDMLFARDALRHLHIPVWNPYVGTGEPTWATQQHASLFPINLVAIVLPFWQSLEWLAALKLLAAGLGTLLFLRRLGLRPAAATLGGVTFAFSSYLIGWLEHPLANAWALLPLLMWAADRLAIEARARDAGLVALLIGSALLGGNPQSAAIGFVVVAPWFVLRLVQRLRAERAPARAAMRPVLLALAASVLGVLLAAIVLVPFSELAGQADSLNRNGGPLPRSTLLTFVAPELWGRPDKFEIAGGPLNYLERTAYFGAIPLLLAVGGLVARRRAPQIFFAVLGLLVLGYVTKVPVYTDLIGHIPVLDIVNRDRFLVLCDFAGAVLAAYGLQELLEAEPGTRRKLLVAGTAVAALVPLFWVARHHDVLSSWRAAIDQLPNVQRDPSLPRPVLQLAAFMRWGLFAGCGLALVVLAVCRPRWRVGIAVALVALTGIDLVSYQKGFHPATPIAWADPPEPPLASALASLTQHDRLGGLIEMQPNLAERFHIRDVRVYESPVIGRRYALWTALGGQGSDAMELPPDATKAADVFAVKYNLSYALSEKPSAGWKPIDPAPVVLNRGALPRAFVAYDWRPANGRADALAKVRAGPAQVDYAQPVIERVAAPPAAAKPTRPGRVTFQTDGERGMRLAVNAARPGWLVLNDTWYPGWKAEVDGRAQPIQHANVAFRAVRVPEGRHSVTFTYEPTSVRIGELLTLLGLLGIGALFAVPAVARRRAARASSAF
jgi:membrane protein YfhO